MCAYFHNAEAENTPKLFPAKQHINRIPVTVTEATCLAGNLIVVGIPFFLLCLATCCALAAL